MLRLAVLVALGSLTLAGCQQGTDAPKPQAKPVHVPAAAPGKDVTAQAPASPPALPRARQVAAPYDVVTPPADAEKLASGLVIKTITEGTGATPGRNDQVKIRYAAWRQTDGTTFAATDASAEPTTMFLFSSAPGFAEGLTRMKVGGKAMLWIPADIGYPGKPRGTPESLTYQVELIDVVAAPATPPDVTRAPPDAATSQGGVRWKQLKRGSGAAPRPWDIVHLGYTGWDATGRIIDSSEVYGKPVEAPLDRLPPVFADVVPQMAVGARVRLWFPASMLGGARPDGPQGVLCFEVALNEVTRRAEPPKAPADVATIPADAQRTPRGVAYKVLTAGTGTRRPIGTDAVSIVFSGWTTDGRLIDSSVSNGKPSEFKVGGVIAGWTEALLGMVVGDKWRIWIPEELAYKGAQGKPQGMLVFDLELVEIKTPPAAPAPAQP